MCVSEPYCVKSKKIVCKPQQPNNSDLATHFRDQLQRDVCPESSRRPTVLDEFEYYDVRRNGNYARAVTENSRKIDASLTKFKATSFVQKRPNEWYTSQKDRVIAMKKRRDARLE